MTQIAGFVKQLTNKKSGLGLGCGYNVTHSHMYISANRHVQAIPYKARLYCIVVCQWINNDQGKI